MVFCHATKNNYSLQWLSLWVMEELFYFYFLLENQTIFEENYLAPYFVARETDQCKKFVDVPQNLQKKLNVQFYSQHFYFWVSSKQNFVFLPDHLKVLCNVPNRRGATLRFLLLRHFFPLI